MERTVTGHRRIRGAVTLAVLAAGLVAVLGLSATRVSAAGRPAARPYAQEQQPPEAEEPPAERPEARTGRQIYLRDCAICHGSRGRGSERGPSIVEEGAAGVHFMVSTGRMPLPNPAQYPGGTRANLARSEPDYTDGDIAALVDYVRGFVDGPEVPEVTVSTDLLPRGGKLYRLNCAACHQFAGVGGVLYEDRAIPTLHFSTPVQVVEAIRTGPSTMPPFGRSEISEEDADAIASYVAFLQHPPDRGGAGLVHLGPFMEGMIGWLVGLGLMLVAIRWIGSRT